MNSRTSSSASFDLVAQNENDVVDTLHGQNHEIEPNIDKESTADQAEAGQLEEMKQLKGEVIAKMEEFQKQQQHNIDESAKMEQLNMDHLQSDQKQMSAPVDQGTSQLNGDRSAKIVEECQKQQQQNIDALTEARKGNGGAIVV
uniref:Uncharacterized protein n=1 Tax=Globodera rostochiensis TaxID=31243 RepID=A0A914GXN0_GLORO